MGESKDKYLDAKLKAQHGVYTANRNTEKETFTSVKDNKWNIFCVVKKNGYKKQDSIREKSIRGNNGNISLDDESKKVVWKQYYEHFLNIEFPWSQNLPHVDPVAGPAQFMTPDDILKSLACMKNEEAAGTSDLVVGMLKLLLVYATKSLQIWWNLSYLRKIFLPIGVTAPLLVYLRIKDML